MKKNYIEPINKVCEIDLTSSLLLNPGSPTPNLDEGDAKQGGAGTDKEVNGDGDGYAKGESFWGSGW
ncbi:MAG: hypothetical protein KBT39_03945 [Bacteroidales bacterium]|nr:hypothetical protein [Bacteroidales bacterium]